MEDSPLTPALVGRNMGQSQYFRLSAARAVAVVAPPMEIAVARVAVVVARS